MKTAGRLAALGLRIATERIAACAMNTMAIGFFCLRDRAAAANEMVWAVAA
jgi:hypothetical protein